jgi:hypothetical protein
MQNSKLVFLASMMWNEIPMYELTNSVALVCERTIPTDRPPFVGKVIDNFCG